MPPSSLRSVLEEIPQVLRATPAVKITVEGDVPMYDVLSHLVAAGYVVRWTRETGIVVARPVEASE